MYVFSRKPSWIIAMTLTHREWEMKASWLIFNVILLRKKKDIYYIDSQQKQNLNRDELLHHKQKLTIKI